jgi:MinD-like ATPase involved in chromosome partitioning or flagellar assembly
MEIIASSGVKGGVGKSTFAILLASLTLLFLVI